MKISSKYKRFKRINFTDDTLPLSDTRSSILRTIQRYHSYVNTANLRRSEKQAQINEIDTQKTNKLLSVCDRTFWLFLHLIFEIIPILVINAQIYTLILKKRTSMNKNIQ